ncbi:MAG: SDR family oxidoreductase [Nitrospirota bacterium]
MDLKNKSILITGASKRIGAEFATAIAAKGAQVAIHYNHSLKEAKAVARAIEKKGGIVCLTQGDLIKPSDCARIVKETVKAFGALDVLINNAAVFYKTPLLQTTEKEWDHTLGANLKALFFCAQAAAKVMCEGAKIINIADWSAVRPHKNYIPYCVSKAGVIALTRGLARTLAPKITVNAISPGPILLPEDCDPLLEATLIQQTPLKRIGAPNDLVNTVLFLLEGTDFMTGSTITVDGGRLVA